MSLPAVEHQAVGVIGRPIQHSLSPLLHAAAFRALGLAWTSTAYDVGAGEGQGVIDSMRSLHLKGLSVTMPLKEEMMSLVDKLDPIAERLGSINCLTMVDDEIIGTSTDGFGLLAAISRSHEMSLENARVVIVGSGGAARSVAAAVAHGGASEVSVVARNLENAAKVATMAGAVGRVGDPTDAGVADIVIETTPVGMNGTNSELAIPLVDVALLHKGQLIIDLVYNPLETPWLVGAKNAGAKTMGGLGMLVHQAALAIEIWTGCDAPVEAMWQAAETVLR